MFVVSHTSQACVREYLLVALLKQAYDLLSYGASGSGQGGSGLVDGSYEGDLVCDTAMCRTTDGLDGFDCWADGVWEAFACADGYLAVLTGESWLNGDGTRLQ